MAVRVTDTTPRAAGFVGTAVAARNNAIDLSPLAGAVGAFADNALAARQRADQVELVKTISDFNTASAQQLDAAARGYDGAKPGFANDALAAHDKLAGDMLAQISNPRIRERAQAEITAARGNFAAQATRLETDRTDDYALKTASDTVLQLRNQVLIDPSQEPAARRQISALAALVPAGARQKFIAAENQQLTDSFLEGRLRTDPFGLEREIKAGRLNAIAKPEDLARALNGIDAERKRRQAEAARQAALTRAVRSVELQSLMRDDLASLEATGQGVASVNIKEIASVLGADDAARYALRRDTALKSFRATEGIEDQSIGDIAARLQKLAPAAGAAGFADQSSIAAAAAARARAEINARLADPAGYYLARDANLRDVRAGYDARQAQGDPLQRRAFEAYAFRNLTRQQAGGVPPAQQRVLTKSEAATIAGNLTSGAPAERVRKLRDFAAGADLNFGRQADRVLQEVVAAGAPKELAVLRGLKNDPIAATTYAQAIEAGSSLTSLTAPSDRTRLSKEARAQSERLIATIGDAGTAATYEKAIASSAEYLMATQGLTPERAAREAARGFTDSYVFAGSYRVPRVIEDDSGRQQRLDTRAVVRSAEERLDRLVKDNGSALAPVGPSGLSDEARRRVYADFVKRNARWVTSADESGLDLVDGQGNPILGADGRPIAERFEALAAGRQSRAAPQDQKNGGR